ncbi:MAG: DnaB-like helicase C-terminal domain-containing protein [Bacteriovorax sp.]|nr:DnaB-like helicase C-terminal domain-containing protein [Bacteriovorax sp.]
MIEKQDVAIRPNSLNQYIGTLKPGQLITIASRPGMGKTSLALNMAIQSCEQANLPILIFSLEMDEAEVLKRLISSLSKVDSRKIRIKDLNLEDTTNLAQATSKIKSMPIHIFDDPKISSMDIYEISKRVKQNEEIGLIVVDYIQLLAGNENPDIGHRVRVSSLYRNLKSMAKKLNCPIIALSQLDIAYEPGTNKKLTVSERPMTACLRDTADSDVILILHRDDYYNHDSKVPGIAEVNIYKNRGGETGILNLRWVGSYLGFEDLDEKN